MDIQTVIVEHVGSFERYQKLNCLLLGMAGFFLSWYSFDIVFAAATPEHWCTPPDLSGTKFEDLNYEAKKVITIPIVKGEYTSCTVYDLNFSDPQVDITYHNDGKPMHPWLPKKKCQEWTYDRSTFETTAVTEVRKTGSFFCEETLKRCYH